MPVQKRLFADRGALLRGLEREYDAELSRLNQLLSGPNSHEIGYASTRADRDTLQTFGVSVDVGVFVGRELSPTLRLYHQRELRKCEAEGLVEVQGIRAKRAKLTGKGRAWLANQRPAANPAIDLLAAAQE